jgi:hypothetical protein
LSGRQYSFEEVTQFPSPKMVIDHPPISRDAVFIPFIERGNFAQS